MSWPFDDGSDLPLRDGFDVGGAQERTMGAMVGGYSGIRTVEELNPDGSITILRTRGGRPIFETTGVARRSSQAQKYRGFVAKIPSRAVLFDPYTLDILDANYQPAVNTYSVQDFATTWNVPSADDTDWYDVVLFDGSTIKVNAKAMPTLGITANHGYPAIPYVINRETAEDQYGNAERNTTEKRVFAVGRYSVTSWGGSGVTETLTPTAPRTEDRALTIGQRVDHATNKAWLGQLYHPAAGWDASGEWAFTSAEVTMMLTSTYLVKVAGSANVAMPLASFGSAVGSSGTLVVDETLPETPVTLISDTAYINFSATDVRVIWWPWSGTESHQMDGSVSSTYTRNTYSAAESSSESQAGHVIDYAMVNQKLFDTRSESLLVKAQTIPLADHSSSINFIELKADATTMWWGSEVEETRGARSYTTIGGSISGGPASRNHEIQTINASVTASGIYLVDFSAVRTRSSGEMVIASPNLTYYDKYLESPEGLIGSNVGTGLYSKVTLGVYSDPGSDIIPVHDYYKQNPSPPPRQTPEVLSEIAAEFDAEAALFVGQRLYDNENSSGFLFRTYYYGSVSSSVNLDTSTMSWSSKDFLLYDETNGVYISVEGEFVGVDTAATLTVILKVQTRHHTVQQTLGEYSYTYSQLVQEREIGTTGKYAMPSPQIRAIFAPLFQEQGSFKGAHYVTAEEESNGATPAHLFNFVLYPEPYGAIGTLNATNDEGRAIHFVPCNLLEMLYAFVFSQEYGVAEDGTRYPVTFTARYNDMMSTLFSSAYRVSVRDGVQGNWSDSLGADFASISTVSLHRT